MINHKDAFLEYPTEEINHPYYSLNIYSTISLAYMVWFAGIPDENYRQGMLDLINLARKYRIRYLLSDGSEIGYISPENKQWMVAVFVPELINSPVKRIARIAYQDYTGFLSNQSLKQSLPEVVNQAGLFELETFTEIDPAVEWLGF